MLFLKGAEEDQAVSTKYIKNILIKQRSNF